jgi:hypothetical protein
VHAAITNADGVMQALLLSWSGKGTKYNNWKYVDRVMKAIIIGFIEDVTVPKGGDELYYSRVKRARSHLKESYGNATPILKEGLEGLFYFEDLLPSLDTECETRRDVQDAAILTQKRSIGLPPPIYRLEAYKEFHRVSTQPAKELSDMQKTIIKDGVNAVWNKAFGNDAFESFRTIARCQRNQKISLGNGADLLHTKANGGKLLSANHYLHHCLPQVVYNLEDGNETDVFVTMEQIQSGEESAGQALFHHAFGEFKKVYGGEGKHPLLFTVKPCGIPDQGKIRVATASHPLHAFLLQPVAQLFKSAYSKIESSTAGMNKQYHLWEFYKRIKPDMVQRVKEEGKPVDRERWLFCKDWKKASDEFTREAVIETLRETGKYFGIPKFYLDMVVWALTAPRIMVLNPKEDVPLEYCPPQWISSTGILQGDPITKNMLHITHVICRHAAMEILTSLAEKSKFFTPLDQKTGVQIASATWRKPSSLFGNQPWSMDKAAKAPPPHIESGGSVDTNLSIFSTVKAADDKEKFIKEVKSYLLEFWGKDGSDNKSMPFNPKELLFATRKRVQEAGAEGKL